MPQSKTIAGLPREEIIEVEVLRKKNEPIIVTFRTKTAQKTLPIDAPEDSLCQDIDEFEWLIPQF